MIDENKVIDIISVALDMNSNLVTIDSSSENIEGWDSLAHLSILVALDRWLNGQAGKISGLATATSVKEIVTLLNEYIDG
jgi:acyl carrier protein